MIKFSFKNHSFGVIETDYNTLMDIWEAFSYYVPNYRFMPAYESGTWDGKIRLINISTHHFPTGLIKSLIEWCTVNNIKYVCDEQLLHKITISKDEILEFIDKNTFYSKGNEIFPREDQKYAIVRAIQEKRCINICPTSFGKSLCIFIQCLWHIKHNRRSLIVVPSVNLVHQFANDIKDYCTDANGDANNMPFIQEIFAGQEKLLNNDTNICITTWQSIYKLDKSWINQFDVIILDEAHKGAAACIKSVFDAAETVEYRTGWTGSLKNASITGMQAESLIGPIKVITDTATLMDAGVVADLTIHLVRFQYQDNLVENLKDFFAEKRKVTGKTTYYDEIAFLESNLQRNKTIIQMAGLMKKTGLLLYTHRKHGQELYKLATNMFPSRNIYNIDGSTVTRNGVRYKTYEELKSIIESEENAILICSFGVFSTGVSIKNLHYIMFTVPIKSYVRTIQSIGRGLRISKTKTKVILIDIIDDLCGKTRNGKRGKENYAYKHFRERFVTYTEQKFKYKTATVII